MAVPLTRVFDSSARARLDSVWLVRAERGTYYIAKTFKAHFMDVWAAFAQHVLYEGDRKHGVSPEMSGNTKVTPIHHACGFYAKCSR